MEYINFLFDWNWCAQPGVKDVFNIIKQVVNVIRIVVPIALIALTTMDIVKKVINPNDKDGQKKIMTRAIAALIVFLLPTIIQLTFRIIDWGMPEGKKGTYDRSKAGLSECWR